MAVASADGATLFVSSQKGNRGAITTFRASPAGFERSDVTLLRAPALELALTPDGSTLVVANDSGVALLDARALAADTSADPRYVDDPGAQITAVNVSRDGRYVFASEELTRRLAVIDIALCGPAIVGRVELDGAPVGIAVSADGSRLYVTSKNAARNASAQGCRCEIAFGQSTRRLRRLTKQRMFRAIFDSADAPATERRRRKLQVGQSVYTFSVG